MLLGVLSDAHGHVGAFELALAVLREAGVEQLRFLGDAVGYIPDPGVVRALQARRIPAIRGNHEAMLLSKCAIAPERETIYRLDELRAQLEPDDLDYLGTWPIFRREIHAGVRCLFVHGGPHDPVFAYVYPDTALDEFVDGSFDVVFMGNTHHPFVRECGGATFVNVGSCGLPRDADARGAVCIFDTHTRKARIVRFEIGASAQRVLAARSLAEPVAALLRRCTAQELDR